MHIKHQVLCQGISTADVVHEEDADHTFETCFVDENTIHISNISYTDVDKIRFYDDPRAQMDGGAKCSVTNIVDILHEVTWYDKKKHRAPVHMRGATSGKIIIPVALGFSTYPFNYQAWLY